MPLKGEGLPVPGRNLQPEKPRQGVMASTTISMPIWDEKHLRAATRAAGHQTHGRTGESDLVIRQVARSLASHRALDDQSRRNFAL